ncbi:unnamed protein product, partial [Brassica rapa subsp. trilocularis]
ESHLENAARLLWLCLICFRKLIQLLGFDPIDKQFKVLYMEGFNHRIISFDVRSEKFKLIKDIEKQEWSEYVYTFPEDIIIDPFSIFSIFIVRVIAAGEIVLSGDSTSKPFYVFYFNLERGSLQSVEIQGNHEAFEINDNRVYVSIDHVEDDKINSMMKKTYMLLQHL